MSAGVTQPSPWCAQGDHDACPHWSALTAGELWRLRPRPEVILCNDPCHSRRNCPLAGRRTAAQDVWSARCTCPGAEDSQRSFERSAEQRRRMAAVFADVDLPDRPDAEMIERRLRDAFLAHSEQPPRGLAGMSRVWAAGTGRRGTRSARLLWLGARAATRAVRWAWQPGAHVDANDRQSLRVMYTALGALIGLAVWLTTAALRTSGWQRLPWSVTALLTWLFTTQMITTGVLVTTAVRTAEGAPPQSESRTT